MGDNFTFTDSETDHLTSDFNNLNLKFVRTVRLRPWDSETRMQVCK